MAVGRREDVESIRLRWCLVSGERLGDMGTIWFSPAALCSPRTKLKERGEDWRWRKGELWRCNGSTIFLFLQQNKNFKFPALYPPKNVNRIASPLAN